MESTYALVALVCVSYVAFKGFNIKRKFRMPLWYYYVGGDSGSKKNTVFISASGLVGAPDAVFFNPFKFRFVIGEFKSRKFYKEVLPSELYQITLYAGLKRFMFLPASDNVLLYGCGHTEKVKYDSKIFKQLLGLRKEYKESSEFGHAIDGRPLNER